MTATFSFTVFSLSSHVKFFEKPLKVQEVKHQLRNELHGIFSTLFYHPPSRRDASITLDLSPKNRPTRHSTLLLRFCVTHM